MMLQFRNIKVGDELPVLSKGPITRQHLVEWCAAENDYYTLHYDDRVAARMKLPGTLIQGTYKMALLGQLIERWMGKTGTLRSLDCSYRGISVEGDTLACKGRVTGRSQDGGNGIVNLELRCENSDGTPSTIVHATVVLAADN